MIHSGVGGFCYRVAGWNAVFFPLLFVLFITACQNPSGKKDEAVSKHAPSFEEQLSTFKQLGFVLNPGVDTSDIDRWENGAREFEEHPYASLYSTLGMFLEREPWTPITNQLWDFDPEAIEEDGDYISIMNNISRITGGELVFDSVADHVDIEKHIAWVAFVCQGEHYRWTLRVNINQADLSLFDRVKELAEKYHAKKKFTVFKTGAEDFVLGYASNEELNRLKQATGLKVEWLAVSKQISAE